MARAPTPGARRGGRGRPQGPAGVAAKGGSSRTADSRQSAAGWQSRLAASDILLKVTDEELDLDAALSRSEPYAGLPPSDRAFARAIASAALRSLGRLDWALAGMVDRPLEEIEPPLRALLRVGAAQLWLLDSPDYAAVSATVEAARRWGPARRGGALLNAVLRRASREEDGFATAPPTSIWPNWVAGRMKAALGPARADALARLQLDEPPIDLSLKDPAAADVWARKLDGEALPNGTVRLKAGVRLTELPGYAEGDWWVQDAGAALAVRLLAPTAGESVIDLCAAPGGKALQIASTGARTTALDISEQRLQALRENVARVGVEMAIETADARTWRPEAPVDAILLDAPCSAMGVLRRLPEAAWRRDPAQLVRYPRIQTELVRAAWDMLRPGGRLVYCVCTPFPEEGEAVIEAALASGWTRMGIAAAEVPGFEPGLTRSGDLLTAPAVDVAPEAGEPTASDVFFLARLEKSPIA